MCMLCPGRFILVESVCIMNRLNYNEGKKRWMNTMVHSLILDFVYAHRAGWNGQIGSVWLPWKIFVYAVLFWAKKVSEITLCTSMNVEFWRKFSLRAKRCIYLDLSRGNGFTDWLNKQLNEGNVLYIYHFSLFCLV